MDRHEKETIGLVIALIICIIALLASIAIDTRRDTRSKMCLQFYANANSTETLSFTQEVCKEKK